MVESEQFKKKKIPQEGGGRGGGCTPIHPPPFLRPYSVIGYTYIIATKTTSFVCVSGALSLCRELRLEKPSIIIIIIIIIIFNHHSRPSSHPQPPDNAPEATPTWVTKDSPFLHKPPSLNCVKCVKKQFCTVYSWLFATGMNCLNNRRGRGNSRISPGILPCHLY